MLSNTLIVEKVEYLEGAYVAQKCVRTFSDADRCYL